MRQTRSRPRFGLVNIRPQASTAGLPEGTIAITTEFCVREGPAFGEGYEWYRVDGPHQSGWVAGNFCGLLERGGCGAADEAKG